MTAILGRPSPKSGTTWADQMLALLTRGAQSRSGPTINYQNALRVSVVLACCRVIAEGVAQLPLKLYLEDGASRKPATDHPLYRVLSRRPNSWMTSFEFRETLTYHALLAKGGFAVINRVGGRVHELLPVTPDRVKVEVVDGEVRYILRMPDGAFEVLGPGEMFHLRGPSWNGFEGMEAIDYAREAIGLAIATEETHADFHRNGAKTAGVLSIQGGLSDPQIAQLRQAFEEATTGRNAFRTVVLDQAAKFERMSMTGVDSQHLETRKYQVEEVCRAMRVFPQMVGYSDKTSTYASAEQFFIAHVTHSLQPWLERWEAVVERDLLTDQESAKGYTAKFTVQAMLRGDAKARAEFYKSLHGMRAITPNEIRALEEMNPIEGGDSFGEEPSAPAGGSKERKVGRVLSGRNEKRIRDAQGSLTDVLAELDKE